MASERLLPGSSAVGPQDSEHWHSKRPVTHRSASLVSNATDASLGPRKRVLLLDDDVDLTSVLTAILETQGHEVTTVNTAVEGLVAIMVCDFDAIICDMVMPNMPGDMFYVAVSRAKPHLCSRFIFITAHAHNPKVGAFLAKIPHPVLHKPFGMDELLETVVQTITRAQAPLRSVPSDPALGAALSASSRRPGQHQPPKAPAEGDRTARSDAPASEVSTSKSPWIVPI